MQLLYGNYIHHRNLCDLQTDYLTDTWRSFTELLAPVTFYLKKAVGIRQAACEPSKRQTHKLSVRGTNIVMPRTDMPQPRKNPSERWGMIEMFVGGGSDAVRGNEDVSTVPRRPNGNG